MRKNTSLVEARGSVERERKYDCVQRVHPAIIFRKSGGAVNCWHQLLFCCEHADGVEYALMLRHNMASEVFGAMGPHAAVVVNASEQHFQRSLLQ